MHRTLNRCVGKTNYSLSKKTKWYTVNYAPSSTDTRCEYCMQHMKILTKDILIPHYVTDRNSFIDCDSKNDEKVGYVPISGFGFGILSMDKSTPMLLRKISRSEELNHKLKVEISELEDYCLHINPNPGNLKCHQQQYYAVEICIDGVPIKSEVPLFYHDELFVQGISDILKRFKPKSFQPDQINIDTVELVSRINIKISVYSRGQQSNNSNKIISSIFNGYANMETEHKQEQAFIETTENMFSDVFGGVVPEQKAESPNTALLDEKIKYYSYKTAASKTINPMEFITSFDVQIEVYYSHYSYTTEL